jgi:hypothetical protein
MNLIDEEREKPIFVQRLRDEWEDSFIKRYIQKDGEIGASLLPEEQKQTNLYKQLFIFRYEQMRLQFISNKAASQEFN